MKNLTSKNELKSTLSKRKLDLTIEIKPIDEKFKTEKSYSIAWVKSMTDSGDSGTSSQDYSEDDSRTK